MYYLLTSMDKHLDFGFGVTGEAYYACAEILFKSKQDLHPTPQSEMPMAFLYRHSIELFLKSLIIIFHKKLKLPYDTEHFDSNNPKILINQKWKDIYNCHWIDELYNYWLNELLLKNATELKKLSDDFKEDISISHLFPLIAKYDRNSSFFRYPVTKNANLDSEKSSMQHIDFETLLKQLETQKGILSMVVDDAEGEFVDGFIKSENVLEPVIEALKKVSYYFNCFHIMTRMTLCNRN